MSSAPEVCCVTGSCLLKGLVSVSTASVMKSFHASALLQSSRLLHLLPTVFELNMLLLIGKAIRCYVSYSSNVAIHTQVTKPLPEPMLLLYRHIAVMHGATESRTTLSIHQASTTAVLHGAMTRLVATTGKTARRAVGPRKEPSRRQQPSTCRALSSLQLVASRYGACSL